MIYHREKVTYFSNKNAITLMRARKGKKVARLLVPWYKVSKGWKASTDGWGHLWRLDG